jgi:hypothetical protein
MRKPRAKTINGNHWPIHCTTEVNYLNNREAHFRAGPGARGAAGRRYDFAKLRLKDLKALRSWLDRVIAWMEDGEL